MSHNKLSIKTKYTRRTEEHAYSTWSLQKLPISLPVRNEKGPSGSGATTVKEKENDGDCENLPQENIPFKDESKNKENSGTVLYLKHTHTHTHKIQLYLKI